MSSNLLFWGCTQCLDYLYNKLPSFISQNTWFPLSGLKFISPSFLPHPLSIVFLNSSIFVSSNPTGRRPLRRNFTVTTSPSTYHFPMDDYLSLFVNETTWYNQIVLGSLLPDKLWIQLPHFVQTWLRNYIAGTLVYLISGFLWCFYIYHLKRNVYVPKDAIPARKAMYLQIYVAMKAMPWYCALPAISEYMVENGWTRCFSRISDVGWASYIWYMSLYLILVEFGIYWMHRELHDIKPFYKWLHATHHIYNKQNTLSPFAGLAFHPIDGILQAVPHVIALFLVPTHFMTHIVLLFMEAIWTANIHDCIHGKLWPVMGAGYHTIHHTTYRHNYGHYTVWMDWMFGTLRDPLEEEAKNM